MLIFNSCNNKFINDYDSDVTYVCPAEIKKEVYRYASMYNDVETVYELGGQDAIRTALKMDCSGLVVMCYFYATENSNYKLMFDDARVIDLYNNFTILTETPEQGDLIFMGDDDISHIAIFEKIENGNVYFIDATLKENINGVSKRFYPLGSEKIKAFGIMRLYHK